MECQGAPERRPSAERKGTNDAFLVVSTDTMGKEEEIGKVLMKAFFETMKSMGEPPHTIFFLNAGVKLTTTNDQVFPILQDIAAKGVEIYSCGTCLKHYNLEGSLKVGNRGATSQIIEAMQDMRIVWI